MQTRKNPRERKVFLQFFGVLFLSLALFTATKLIQSPTNFINKAADSCGSIIIQTEADKTTCNNKYFTSSGFGCQAVSLASSNCGTFTAPECTNRLGCNLTTTSSSCIGLTQPLCDGNVASGCVSSGVCKPSQIQYKKDCSTTSKDICLSKGTKCSWEFTGCSGTSVQRTCQGNYFTCIQALSTCTPNSTKCDPNLYTCSANGSTWNSTPCATGCVTDTYGSHCR